MASLYNQTSGINHHFSSVSISYDYLSGLVNFMVYANDPAQSVAGINLYIELTLMNGDKVALNQLTDARGRCWFEYDLKNVYLITCRTDTAQSQEINSLWHQAVVLHAAEYNEQLTLACEADGFYLNLNGKLKQGANGVVANVPIELKLINYDIDDKVITLTVKTNAQGEFSARYLMGSGDWDIQAFALVNGAASMASKVINRVLRDSERGFVATVGVVDIDNRYTGYATTPSTGPRPAGTATVVKNSLWSEEQHYLGRTLRDNSSFYVGFFLNGATRNDHFGFPELFALDQVNTGFITGSTLIINDVEKYNMGQPISYANNHVYFDVTKNDGKIMFDKYFLRGKAPQEIKMEWVFRI